MSGIKRLDDYLNMLTPGTFVRWIDPEPGSKPLGIVLSSPSPEEDVIYVLMIDHQGATDLEVFVARREATGFDASNLVQQSMEVVESGDPELMSALRRLGPGWWHMGAHLDGGHADQPDPECPLCQTEDETP
jgi:hypothetical protein